MQRHEQIIQLSDHVKNKLKQHKRSSIRPSFIDSSDEFIEINTIDDDDDDDNSKDNFSSRLPSPDDMTRQRRDTYTIFKVKQPSDLFFTDRKPELNQHNSLLEEKYKQQKECEKCIRSNRIINLQRQDLIRLYNQNKQLNHQLHSSILLNHQYKNDIERLKHHLTKVNSHLYQYQTNFDDLKQKILSDKKTHPKIDEEEEEEEEEEERDEEDITIDHIKRLRYEIQMYNRIVAAKEKNEQKQIDLLF